MPLPSFSASLPHQPEATADVATSVPVVRDWLSEAQRFLLLSVVIGLCAGLLVVCFHETIELISWSLEDRFSTSSLRWMIPGFGAALAAALVRYVFPDARGSGIVQTKAALYVSGGRIPAAAVPGKFIACSVSIGAGAPLGPEDPSLLMGAGVASTLGRIFNLSPRSTQLLAPIGAAAGIAAAFNTPITGVLFVIEEVVAAWNGTVLGSIVLAAVAAVVTARVFLGDTPLFTVPDLAAIADPREAFLYAILGLGAGLLAAIYVRVVAIVRGRFDQRGHVLDHAGPLMAGFAVGTVAIWFPEVLGAGYGAMDSALHSQFEWSTLVALGLAKLVLAAIAFGTKTPGGLFAPTLFVGAMLGGAVGELAPRVVPFPVSSTSAYVLAGMGGFFAGVFRAPMTAIFMVFELSATYIAIVPAMVASTVSYLVARQLQPTSLLDLVGLNEGTVLPSAQEQRESEPLRVEQALTSVPVFDLATLVSVARATMTENAIPAALVRLNERQWAALDRSFLMDGLEPPDDRLVIGELSGLTMIRPIHPDEPLDRALRRLAQSSIVPVVSRVEPSQLLGVVTLVEVHRAYGHAREVH